MILPNKTIVLDHTCPHNDNRIINSSTFPFPICWQQFLLATAWNLGPRWTQNFSLALRLVPQLFFGLGALRPQGIQSEKDIRESFPQPALSTNKKTFAWRERYMGFHLEQVSELRFEGWKSWSGSTTLSLSRLGAEDLGFLPWFHHWQLSEPQGLISFGINGSLQA